MVVDSHASFVVCPNTSAGHWRSHADDPVPALTLPQSRCSLVSMTRHKHRPEPLDEARQLMATRRLIHVIAALSGLVFGLFLKQHGF
jgi:hypothetical protein